MKLALFPIEISNRELPYKLNLASKLANNDFFVVTAPKKIINIIMRFSKGFLYFDKGYHRGVTEKIINKVRRKNGIIVSLDEEGAVDFDEFQTLKNRYNKDFINIIDRVYTWGELQSKLISEFEVNDKVVISGHPRFCYNNQDIYKDEILKIKNKYKDYILINTNFGFGNHLKGDDFVLSNYNRISYIKSLIYNDKIKLNNFILLIKELLDQGYTIVLRPHPEENPIVYRNLASENKNFFVEEFSLSIPFILASKCSIHCDCTTGVEAFFLNKITYSYQPKTLNNKFITVLPTLVSNIYEELDELVDAIEKDKNLFSIENPESVLDYIEDPCGAVEKITDDILSNFYNKLTPLNIFKFSLLVSVINFLFKYNFLKLNSLVMHKTQFSDDMLNYILGADNFKNIGLKQMYNFVVIRKKN